MEKLEINKEAQELYPSMGEDSCYVDLGLIEQDAFIAGAKWVLEQLQTIPDGLYLQIEDKKVEKFGGLWNDIEKQKAYCDGQCDTIDVIENWLKSHLANKTSEDYGDSTHQVNLPDATYNGVWSGFILTIPILNDGYKITTKKGVKGIDVKVQVEVTNGSLKILK